MEEKGIIMKKNGPLSSFYGPASGAVHKLQGRSLMLRSGAWLQ